MLEIILAFVYHLPKCTWIDLGEIMIMKRVIGIASGILILAGVGYYFVNDWAQDKAEKEVTEARQQILKFMKEKVREEFSITYEYRTQ